MRHLQLEEGFTNKKLQQYYLDYDVTNYYEMTGMGIIILLNFYLLTKLLVNFRAILSWYLQNEEVDPRKLICINSILFISVTIRLICENYSLIGCILSDFVNFNSDNEYVYNNITLYTTMEQLYIQSQNLAMIVASKFWLYVIQLKYIYEGHNINADERKTHGKGSLAGKPSSYLTSSFGHPTQSIQVNQRALRTLKIFSYILRFSWIFVIIATIYCCIQIFLGTDIADSISQGLIITTTVISGIAFSLSCLIIYLDLEVFYTVDPQYKQRLRKASLFLIFTQIIRFSFNVLKLFGTDYLIQIKSGQKSITFPDEGVYWQKIISFFNLRALIIPVYSIIVDFIPTLFLSELFSPLARDGNQVADNPQQPDNGWDIKSLS